MSAHPSREDLLRFVAGKLGERTCAEIEDYVRLLQLKAAQRLLREWANSPEMRRARFKVVE